MDFVVAGLGLGALVLLLGLAVRDLAPRLRRSAATVEPDSSANPLGFPRFSAIAPASWAAFCASLALALLIAGAAILLVTFGGVAAQVSDAMGARLVLAATLLCLGGAALRGGQLAERYLGLDPQSRAEARARRHLATFIAGGEDTAAAVVTPVSANHHAEAATSPPTESPVAPTVDEISPESETAAPAESAVVGAGEGEEAAGEAAAEPEAGSEADLETSETPHSTPIASLDGEPPAEDEPIAAKDEAARAEPSIPAAEPAAEDAPTEAMPAR